MPPYSVFEKIFNTSQWKDVYYTEELENEEPIEDTSEWFEFDEKEFSMTDKDDRVKPLVREEFLFDNEFELLYRLISQVKSNKRSNVFDDLIYILKTDKLSVRCDISRKKSILKEIERVRFLSGKTLEQEKAYSMAVKIIDKLFIEDAKFKKIK